MVRVLVLSSMLLLSLAGCQKPVHFPTQSLEDSAKAAGALAAYDARGSGKADFFLFANPQGRVSKIGFSYDGKIEDMKVVDLDLLDFKTMRHLVIILDGFGYDVVKDYYDKGGLRLFYPPSRVIAPYPTLTDLCMEDMLNYIPAKGFEAKYYCWDKNRQVGGADEYLTGSSAPYNDLLHYRANLIWDALTYIAPWQVFGKELNDAKRKWDRRESQEFIAYFVSSAGVVTRHGEDGQRRSLQRVEQLVNQLFWETHGQVAITLLADHGHSYTAAKRIPLEKFLKERKWRIVEKLKRPRDVAYIRFGLETYASFATMEGRELASDLVQVEGVEIASYVERDCVVVLAPEGQRAVIVKKGESYSYRADSGDPLLLKPILAKLKPDEHGFYGRDDIFQATLSHEYPCPLERIWRAHFDLVENPPTVIISLDNEWYSGSNAFDFFVNVASTHGGLNYVNSTTFIMSTAGPLPPAMRTRDLHSNINKLTGCQFPLRN